MDPGVNTIARPRSQPDHSRRAPRALGAALLALACALAGPAFGQTERLPEGIASRTTLAPADVEAVRSFVTSRLGALGAEDAGESQRARDALLAPLRSGASVAFRLEYSKALSPALRDLARGDDERIAFNALRLAGALSTDESVQIIRDGLRDQRPSVRYGAAYASRIALDHALAGRAPLPDAQIDSLIEAVAVAIEGERDPTVLAGLIATFDVTARTGRAASAIRRMAGAVGKQVRAYPPTGADVRAAEWASAFGRSVSVASAALLQQLKQGAPDAEFARETAILCGRCLALAERRVDAAEEEEASALRDLVAASETTLLFIDSALTGRRNDEQAVTAAWDAERGGREGALSAAADAWIGQSGALTKSPYGAKPADFEPLR